jgi:hypothetical protein
MDITKADLKTAISTIGRFFTEDGLNKDGEIVNLQAYPQGRILNAICYGASQMLANSKYNEAVARVKSAARGHRGDELSEEKLKSAVAWAQRLEMQDASIAALLAAAEEVHEEITGSPFRPGKEAPVDIVPTTEALAQAQAFLGKKVAPATDYNTNVAQKTRAA